MVEPHIMFVTVHVHYDYMVKYSKHCLSSSLNELLLVHLAYQL